MRSIKVAAAADVHGRLDFEVPRCHLLVIGGDLCPWKYGMVPLDQAIWLREEFAPWLKKQNVGHTVVTWGNHDWIGQKAPHLVPKIENCHFLVDQGHRIAYGYDEKEDEEYRIWGTPWQPPFCDWAFNLPEPELKKRWSWMPPRIDVLVCHGPPRGYGDLIPLTSHRGRGTLASGDALLPGYKFAEHELMTDEGLRIGSPSLTEKIMEVKPKLVVFGHVHAGFGRWEIDHGGGRKTVLANVAMVNDNYERVREPQVFEVPWK